MILIEFILILWCESKALATCMTILIVSLACLVNIRLVALEPMLGFEKMFPGGTSDEILHVTEYFPNPKFRNQVMGDFEKKKYPYGGHIS